jgi:hypothetical protein
MRSLDLKNCNEKCFILYSGGIDSTAMLISILKNWNKQEQSRVTVLCTPHSYYEFPDFFKIINQHFKIEYCKNQFQTYFDQGLLVSGIQADLLFPNSHWIEYAWNISEDLVYKNYKDSIPKIFEIMFPGYGQQVFNKYHEIVVNPIFEVKNTSDFCYWFWYSQFYHKVVLHHCVGEHSITSKESFDKLYNFYDFHMFETWSLKNVQRNTPLRGNNLKKPLKDYIIEYTKLKEYVKKSKIPSYGNVHSGNRFTNGITESWEFISLEKSLQYLKS